MAYHSGHYDGFIKWLGSRFVREDDIRGMLIDIEIVGDHYSLYNECGFDIWSINSSRVIDSIVNKLVKREENNEELALKYRKKSLLTYKKYLLEIENSNDDTYRSWRTDSVVDTKYDFLPKVGGITKYLVCKYSNNPASSLSQLIEENEIINFGYFNKWTKELYGLTAAAYLTNIGVLNPKHEIIHEEPKRISDEERLNEIVVMLKRKYSDSPARTYTQIVEENKDISFVYFNSWTRRYHGKSASQYLIDVGVLSRIEDDTRSSSERLSLVTQELLQKYLHAPAKTLSQVARENPQISITLINKWSKDLFGITAKSYLEREGIIKSTVQERIPNESVRQPAWDKYEAAILIDAFFRMQNEQLSKKDVVINVSEELRERAIKRGVVIDDTYRNQNGISFRLSEIEYLYSGGIRGVANTSSLFKAMMKLYSDDQDLFRKILLEARSSASSNEDNKNKQSPIESQLTFKDWIIKNHSTVAYESICEQFKKIDEFLRYVGIDYPPIIEISDKKKFDYIVKVANQVKFGDDGIDLRYAVGLFEQYLSDRVDDRVSFNQLSNDGRKEESVTPDISSEYKDMHTGLINIVDYLKGRYDVFLKYDHFKFPQNQGDLLYKVYLNDRELMWVYFIYSNTSKYISVETEPHLFDEDDRSMVEVDKCLIRKTYPCLKLFFKRPSVLLRYMPFICDAIERHLYDSTHIEKTKVERVNKDDLYRRLKSMASVYDDIEGHDIEWIRDKLGISIELNELKEILANVSWVVEVDNGVYSFSKNATANLDYDRESLMRVLMQRYQNGMQFDSIDLENYRETYCEIIGEKLEFTDKQLITCLSKCGVIYKGRLFPPEGIINESAKKKLIEYIDNNFSKGKQVLYYKAIYSDLSDVFAYCFNLTDAMMLRPYLEYIYGSNDYYFTDEYISNEKDVDINHSVEIEEYLLEAGKPLSYDEIYTGLSHLSKDIINGVIKSNSNIIMNGKENYFHYGIFELSSEEADIITDCINNSIEEDGYCIWSLVYDEIKELMPIFIENNVYLSPIGMRNAVARKLSGRFHFDGEVICHRGETLSMTDVYRLFGEKHTPFSDDDLYNFSKEVNGGVIYFDSLSENAIRVSRNLFVSRKNIRFDVDATDNSISTYLDKGYMLIRDMDSFLVFPNIGYEWNVFLLESYLMYFSKKYALVNNGRSLHNVAGAVVRKGSGYDDFVDICSDVLANSECPLTKDKALDYLGELNLLTRRSYKKIDQVLLKAKQIRSRKES